MIVERESPGLNWHSNDPAHLYFARTGDYQEAPREISAFIIGRLGTVRPATRAVELETLQFLGCGIFGPSRPCGFNSTTRWTGDDFKFGIYQERDQSVVIIRSDGSGTTAYAIDETDALPTWLTILGAIPPEQIWNLCATITGTYRKGCDDARGEVYKLFLGGKLKRRKRHGVFRVEVLR